MAAGIFGYMGYDTVRLIEHLPGEKPDRLGLPDSILVRPTLIVIFDSVKDEMTVVTPVRPAPGVSAKAAYARAADRLNLVVERLDQPLPHASEPDLDAAHPEPKIDHRARGLYGQGQARQGVHRRRRHLPGGVEPALRGALHAALVRALSRAAARQPLALPLLSQFRRLRRGGVEPRDPGAGSATARSRSGRSPARGRAARARKRTRRSPRSCSPTPRSAPSI